MGVTGDILDEVVIEIVTDRVDETLFVRVFGEDCGDGGGESWIGGVDGLAGDDGGGVNADWSIIGGEGRLACIGSPPHRITLPQECSRQYREYRQPLGRRSWLLTLATTACSAAIGNLWPDC